ncbi:hypothetical protein AB0K81_26795 [Streptomyces werraensis]|uniref:Uncharacterized protein n=1 Tax=Streptomyces werraensis TaxID=68284 RepID=A0ABV3J6G4_9ACTN
MPIHHGEPEAGPACAVVEVQCGALVDQIAGDGDDLLPLVGGVLA